MRITLAEYKDTVVEVLFRVKIFKLNLIRRLLYSGFLICHFEVGAHSCYHKVVGCKAALVAPDPLQVLDFHWVFNPFPTSCALTEPLISAARVFDHSLHHKQERGTMHGIKDAVEEFQGEMAACERVKHSLPL